ncbi:dsRBD fold-containing protein [Saccharomonospora sp. NPDC046836]|uniref:dsRBD fold-containing protein n=1 Tax=Saccharomonospora sp. NPDC046836 TaxID=3156921 RepID=UPI0033E1362D
MARLSQWTISVVLDEKNGTTRARVRLGDADGNHFDGIGLADREIDVARVPQVAGELALARALTDLTEELLTAIAADLESATVDPAFGATQDTLRR